MELFVLGIPCLELYISRKIKDNVIKQANMAKGSILFFTPCISKSNLHKTPVSLRLCKSLRKVIEGSKSQCFLEFIEGS